jgi:hypothetical protein
MSGLPRRRRFAHSRLFGVPISLAVPELGLNFDYPATPGKIEML